MKHFIAYFDYLGFKEFLLQNSEEELERRSYHLLRDIEKSLSDKYKIKSSGQAVADLSESNINCLNISDTVIFWTKDDTLESCKELLEVAYRFNWNNNIFYFSVRGCVIYDNFNFISGKQQNERGSLYSPNLMFGKGLLNAHIKTDQLNWAGAVIDNSVVERVMKETNFSAFIGDMAKKYLVLYKGFYKKEYAFLLRKENDLTEEQSKNDEDSIRNNFEGDNKSINASVEEKISNTIKFLRSGIKK